MLCLLCQINSLAPPTGAILIFDNFRLVVAPICAASAHFLLEIGSFTAAPSHLHLPWQSAPLRLVIGSFQPPPVLRAWQIEPTAPCAWRLAILAPSTCDWQWLTEWTVSGSWLILVNVAEVTA